MLKKLLALLLVAVCQNVSAQNLQFCKGSMAEPLYGRQPVTSTLQLNDDEYWWAYFDGPFNGSSYIGMGPNSDIPQYYIVSTCIPAGMKDMDGKTLNGILFSFPSAKNITDVKIWISNKLPKTAENGTVCWQGVENVTGYDMQDPFNEVRFEKPYKIDGTKDTYVGYSFVVNKNDGERDGYPVFTTGMEAHEKGLSVKVGETGSWVDYKEFGFGDLGVKLLLGGGNFDNNSVAIDKTFPDVVSTKNGEADIPVEVINMGGNGITNLDLTIDIAGNKQEVNVVPDSKISGIKTKYNFTVKAAAPSESGKYDVRISVDKVNGVANMCADNKAEGKMMVVSRIADRKVLFEEFTATWCANCPRGAVGIEKSKLVYGDKIIPVAVHSNDEMDCFDYAMFIKATVKGFPGCHINRKYMSVDPYYGKASNKKFGVADLIDECLNEVPVAEIKASASVVEHTLTVKSNVKFLFTGDVACAVGYILTSDSIKNDEWWQGNIYTGATGYEDEPLFDKWVNAGKHAKGIPYYDVAICGVGVEKGYNPTVITKAVEEESNEYSLKINLADFPLVKENDKLGVCVFLYDRKSNQIINADKIAVDVSTGIEEIETDGETSEEVARYTIDGRRINRAEKGVNIVKYSDGKVKKIIVR